MTFKELREWLDELDETQLAYDACVRDADVGLVTLALTHSGVPFFTIESDQDGQPNDAG